MKHLFKWAPPLWLACILSFVIAIAFGSLVLSLTVSECAKNLKCASAFQYAYLSTMNNAIMSYPGDVYYCHARGYPELVDFVSLQDESGEQLECKKVRPNQGIITKVITPPTRKAVQGEQQSTDRAYRDETFGIEFSLFSKNGKDGIKKDGNRLTSTLGSGSITRFEIDPQSDFRMALVNLITDSKNSNLDVCSIDFSPWMPNFVTPARPGQIAAVITHSNYEKIATEADQKVSKLDIDEGSQGQEAIALINDTVTRDCSRYSNISEWGGYFLYDPVTAPNRFYFVERTSKAGDPNFYDWGTITILP